MRVFGVYAIVVSTAMSLSSLYANDLPRDLEDLSQRWSSVEKVDDSEFLMGMEVVGIEGEADFFKIIQNDFVRTKMGSKKIEEFHFLKIKENSRNFVLAKLFPKDVTDLAFCEHFPDPKIKDEKKLAETRFRNCKIKVKEMLGGILHSDPELIFGEAFFADGSSDLLFYVPSMLNSESFLKFEFKRH